MIGKKTEKTIFEKGDEYRLLFDTIVMGMSISDTKGNILISNDYMSNILGYSRDELKKTNASNLYENPKDREKIINELELKGSVENLEVQMVTKYGLPVWVNLSVRATKYKGIDALVSSFFDITKQKVNELKLKMSEQRYCEIFNDVEDGIICFNSKGYIIETNKAFSEIVGIKSEEVIGRHCIFLAKKFINLKELPRILKYIKTGLKGEIIGPFLLEFNNKILEIGTPHQSGTGKHTALLRDVTEKIKYEDRIKVRERKIQSIFSAVPVGIGVVINRIIKSLNTKLCDMLEYTEKELIDKDASILYSTKEDYDYVGKEKYHQIKKFGTGSVETRFKTKNGKILDVILSSTPIDNKDLGKGITFSVLDITEKKKQEIGLLKSEMKFKCLYENIPLGYQSLDKDGKFIEVNSAWLNLFGYKKDKVIGRKFGDFLTNEIKLTFKDRWSKFKKVGHISDVNFDMVKKDGSIIIVLIDGSVSYDKDGKFVQTHCILRDVTKQKQQQKEIRESKDKYLSLFENTGAATGIFADDGTIQMFNTSFERLSGYSREEILGKMRWFDFVSKDDLEKMMKYHKQRSNKLGNPPTDYECNITDKQGKIKRVNVKIGMIGDTGMRIVSLIDISRLKDSEDKLRESEEKYISVFENTGTATVLFGDDGIITLCNSSFEVLSGYSKDKIINKMKWSDFVSDEDLLHMKNYHIQRSKKSGNPPISYEFDFVDVKGKRKRIHVKVGFIASSNIRICSLTDITDLKKAEEETKKLTEKVISLTKKVPLTQIEKETLFGLVNFPLFNDRQLAKQIGIKRSTITSIRNKLVPNFFTTHIIPNYAALGCEIISVTSGDLNTSFPETIYSIQMKRLSVSILVSKNFAELKRIMDVIENLSVKIINIPIALYQIEQYFSFSRALALALGINAVFSDYGVLPTKKQKLSKDEQIVMYALTRYPILSDYQIGIKCKMSRQKISKIKKNLIKNCLVRVVNIPNMSKLNFDILSVLNFKDSYKPLTSYFGISGDDNLSFCVHKSFDDYKKNQLKEVKSEILIPLKSIDKITYSFEPLLRKLFDIDVDF